MQVNIERIILIVILILAMITFIVVGALGLRPERFMICSAIAGVIGILIGIVFSKNEKFKN